MQWHEEKSHFQVDGKQGMTGAEEARLNWRYLCNSPRSKLEWLRFLGLKSPVFSDLRSRNPGPNGA